MNDDRQHLFDDPKNVRRLLWALFTICGLLLAVDLLDVFHLGYHKHVHYGFEKWFGFYAFYGYFLSVGLVLAAKELRRLLSRDEDYYDR